MEPATIVILADEEDEHGQHMLAHLLERGEDAVLLDSRWFPGALRLSLDPQSRAFAMILPDGRSVAGASIKSVYWRNYSGVTPVDLSDPLESYIAANDARGLFESLLIELPARWINGWDAFRLHQTKPVQLAQVAALGVPIPATQLTNDPEAVLAFAAQHQRVVFKPIQGGDQTRRVTPAHLAAENLESLRLAPVTLQEEIVGANIRVFVAGDHVMACEVRTPELDYREDLHAELFVHELPAAVRKQSKEIAQALSLVWTGIDYRLSAQGKYVFLEANPSPMFLGFEDRTGLPLTARLADLLIGADQKRPSA